MTDETKTKTVQRKRIIYVRPFTGEIQEEDLQLITDDLNVELEDKGIYDSMFVITLYL